jgi:putative addiction module component (TIGR02574 family)
MISNIKSKLNKLSVSERILLVEEIRGGITEESEAFELTKAQKEELERRAAELKQHPERGRTWEDFKSELLGSR